MKVWCAENLPEVIIIEPDVFEDGRGYFLETYRANRYGDYGINVKFVQDNLSFSQKGVLRGLHYQLPNEQAKLVQVIQGEIFDVVVDIRKGSPSFGRWSSVVLSGENRRQVFVPAGFAHGFCVLSEIAYVMYKCSDYYAPNSEGGVLWSDPDIRIEWPVKGPILSDKDASYPLLKEIPEDRLPKYTVKSEA
ncbi:MAG: dTDP-4-dehydrorhamnose 3,5-epimerase [Deltaproteobacteria bacterium]|nr:dTDP-4-dehydrorhamnose 3,5-epimerase [Deltaproteobacteria bacterium]